MNRRDLFTFIAGAAATALLPKRKKGWTAKKGAVKVIVCDSFKKDMIDPLGQRGTIGWKSTVRLPIVNQRTTYRIKA